MIKQKTIDEVNDLPLVEVIAKHVVLKKQGAQYMGKSPFTDEKTGSFSVSPSKNCWKCFSTGKGGNSAIGFMMEKESMTYPDAIRAICSDFGITPEFDNDEKGKQNQEVQQKKMAISDLNALAMEYWQSNLDKLDQSKWRMSKEMAEEIGVGYALDEWKGLYQFLIGRGVSENQIIQAELCTKGEKGNVFDFFKNRIVFPINNKQGQIVGFSGRALSPDAKAKYLNSRETILFDKSTSFLGLNLAKKSIVKSQRATIAEGNFDISALHENKFNDAVGPCGTALTTGHLQVLKSLKCKTIRFIYDGDKAGRNALITSIKMAIRENFFVECAILPEAYDPHDFLKQELGGKWKLAVLDAFANDVAQLGKDEIKTNAPFVHKPNFDFLNKYTLPNIFIDGIEHYAAELFKDANTTIRKSKAEADLENLLSTVADAKLRKNYVNKLAKLHGFNITEAEKGIKARIVERNKSENDDDTGKKWRFPSYLSKEAKEEFDIHGFYEDENTEKKKIGYWFGGQNYQFEKVSNFIVKPLYHIDSYNNNRRLVEILGHRGKYIVEVPSSGFVSTTPFLEECIKKDNFHFFGSSKQFKFIANKFLEKMPKAFEIPTLGKQTSGFWATADGIIENNRFKKVDDFGIVRADVDDKHYFLPAFSSIYKQFQEIDDPYESDRNFVFNKSEIDFKQWAELYHKTHGENGMYAITFFCASILRDFIFSTLSFFPILYNFGDVQTGKSQAARHLSAVLLGNQSPVMLNAVTKAALSRKLAQFRNGIQWLDEYTNDIHEDIFQNLKSSWDGAGRDKGTMTNSNATTSSKSVCAIAISGQYFPTRDGNSLATRQVICNFTVKTEDRTAQEVENFQKLVNMNKKGLSGVLMDILKYEDHIKQTFEDEYYKIQKEMKLKMMEAEEEYNGRVLQNYAVLLAMLRILQEKISFPFTYEDMETSAVKMLATQSSQIQDSDVLGAYWSTVEYLFFNGEIHNGSDFMVRDEISVRRYGSNKKTEHYNFDEKKKVLYIQFGLIHPKYLEAHRKQQGTVGTNATSVQSYMKSSKAFLGICPAHSFSDKRTTAWMFDYSMLSVSMEKLAPHSPVQTSNYDPNKTLEKARQMEIGDDN